MNQNICVCCGAEIPEGELICHACEKSNTKEKLPDYIESCGAILSKTDVRDYKAVCVATTEDFPEEFELQMPDVKNQGSVGSCVAHSIALTIEYFSRLQGDDAREMSVGFIYANRGNL